MVARRVRKKAEAERGAMRRRYRGTGRAGTAPLPEYSRRPDGRGFKTDEGRDEEMTKSELIERIAQNQSQLAHRDVESAVKTILEHMVECLAAGGRIEIRGFGSFSLHHRPARVGRNPKTGATVSLPVKYVPHFKPGKELRKRVNRAYRPLSEADSRPDAGPPPLGSDSEPLAAGGQMPSPRRSDSHLPAADEQTLLPVRADPEPSAVHVQIPSPSESNPHPPAGDGYGHSSPCRRPDDV